MGNRVTTRKDYVKRVYGHIERTMNEFDSKMGGHNRYFRGLDSQFKSGSVSTEEAQRKLTKHDQKLRSTLSRFKSRMSKLLSVLDDIEINEFRYRKFAPHYDPFMADHERSIDLLLRQLVTIEQIGFTKPLVGESLVELSAGTGTVLKLLAEALPQDRVAALDIIANDLSAEMRTFALAKLIGFPFRIDYTSQPIATFDAGRKFRTAILSQTLHLISDGEVVKQERKENYMRVNSDRHVNAKFVAVENAYRQLEDDGTFIVIDEQPALLSDGGGPMGPSFAYLFNDSLRAISWERFRYSIMNQMENSRFVTQLMVPIDSIHTMHLVVYRKDQDRVICPEKLPEDRGVERAEASTKIVSMFRAIEDLFLEGMKPNGKSPWMRFLKKRDSELFISEEGELPESEVNCIILDRILHGMGDRERFDFLQKAIDAVKTGGSLILIDEWPPPKSSPNPIKKSTLRNSYMTRFSTHLDFAGSIRVPISPPFRSGMYGFEYRKVL